MFKFLILPFQLIFFGHADVDLTDTVKVEATYKFPKKASVQIEYHIVF